MTTLTFDAKDPFTIGNTDHRKAYFAYIEHKLGRQSMADPRRNRTLDSSGWGKPASDQVIQGAPKPAPKAQPERVPQNNVDPLRPDEVAKLKHLLQRIEPAAPARTLGEKTRDDAAHALEEAREDHRLPAYKRAKPKRAISESEAQQLFEQYGLGWKAMHPDVEIVPDAEAQTHDATDTASPYRKLGHDLYS